METIVHACDAIIYLTTPDLVSLTDMLKTIEHLKSLRKKALGVIISQNHNQSHDIPIVDIESMVHMPVIGNIPHDLEIPKAQSKKYPVVYANATAPSSIAFNKLAANLIGEPYEHGKENNESFWSYLSMRLGLRDPK